MTIFSANLCHFHPLLVHNDSYIIGDSATNIVSINLQGLVPKVCLFSKMEDSEDDVHETCHKMKSARRKIERREMNRNSLLFN